MMLSKAFRKFGSLLIVTGSLLAGLANLAIAQSGSQQQLDIFRNLSPEQQRAVLDSISRGGNTRGGATADKTLQFPETVRPRGPKEEEPSEIDPRLKPGDTLIVYLEIRRFDGREPRPMPQIMAPTLGGQSTQIPNPSAVVPSATPPDTRRPVTYSPERTLELDRVRERIQRRNPYVLDSVGSLNLPESGPVVLSGLTIVDAEERLSVLEPLRDFKVTITRLPLKPQGTAGLKPFGYDLFAGSPSTFAPATDIPVPVDYVVGPGDTLNVQLIGNNKGNYIFTVDREGKINFPELGPVSVAGQRFEVLRTAIEKRVREQMIGTQVSVTMGELRSIRIFVLGDSEQPGSYTVSGLSTMTNALFVSGGVKPIGSLRNIELKRNGATITKLDLYDLLLKGDTRGDSRLLPGDVIFINPIGPTVGIGGEVRRPAVYELEGATTAKQLVALAGGLRPQADPALTTMERIDDQRRRVTVSVDLASDPGLNMQLKNSDVLSIPGIRPSLEDSVTLSGYLYRPGDFQYRQGMRLSDVVRSIDELRPNADQHYVLIRRELPPNREVAVFSADLAKAVANKGSPADIELMPRDHVHVFDLESGRDVVIEPLMRDLRTQATVDQPTSLVRVNGRVKVPGQYPLEQGMKVSDLIRAGGSLDEAAYDGQAELTRYAVVNGESRQTELIQIDLKRIRAGDTTADIHLLPFDYLVIKEMPLWAQQEFIDIIGEVRFPGRYPIHRGETMRSVLERAGGLTDQAFVDGAIFTRSELRDRERKQIDTLANRMQSDLVQLSLQSSQEGNKDAAQAMAVGQALLANLRATQPVGRLVINLPKASKAKPGSTEDIVLKNGDLLAVPRAMQEVTVMGEVQSATSHLYKADFRRDDYINLSGGYTQRADSKRTYVVKADGSVIAKQGSSWFSTSSSKMAAGDTVVVPLDTQRMRALPLVQAITSIVANLAISAAALASL